MLKLKKLLPLIITLFLTQLLWAGTTGKIVGVVKDKATGEPLPGVNVVVEGRSLGASTDENGVFLILNVPPGFYDVSAIMVGYQKVTHKNVQVMADKTVTVNFLLSETILETEAVVVEAERPLVSKDETNKTAVLDFEVFSEMPIQEFDEAVAVQAGMVADAAGDLHLRGGRAGEIAYMVDGVLIQDPFYKGGAADINLDKYTIQELQVQTGAFSAEYGQAMSGVINIVTKEGDYRNYSLRLEYESPWLGESPYHKQDWMLHSDLVDIPPGQEYLYRDSWRDYALPGDTSFSTVPTSYDTIGVSRYKHQKFTEIPTIGKLPSLFGSPMYGTYYATFSGPVPFVKNMSLFSSYRYLNEPNYLPFGYDARRNLNVKLTYRLADNIKINAALQRSTRYYKPYSHVWKYNPDGLEDRQDYVNRESIELNHTLNNTSFYTLRISRYSHRYYRFNPNRKFKISDYPKEIWSDPVKLDSVIVADSSDWVRGRTNTDGFYIEGDRGRYEDNTTTTYSVKLDFVKQFQKRHEVKTGVEYKNHTVDRDRWRYPWPGSAHYTEIFTYHPLEFAAYIQDKMEYDRFVLNIGVRFDYFDPKASMWKDLEVPGYLDENGNWIPAEEEPAPAQKYISPRIGIAYPVSEKVIFRSSYGHFYETPSFYNMYKQHNVQVGGVPLLGNPKIKSQKTVQYEFGLKSQIGADWSLDINAYFKNITNLAASSFKLVFPYNYTLFDNSDYASVKGIDISLEKRAGRFLAAILNYSLSVAKGNESSATDGYNYYRGVDVTLRPNKEYYLNFDRRHNISLNAILKTPNHFGPKLAGTDLLSNWNANILMTIASGLPYTPFVEEGAENVFIEQNTGRRPWTFNIDLRLQKTFDLARTVRVSAFMVVNNLLNRLNENSVWTRTGRAWDAGPTSSYSKDRIYNPTNVSLPRRISAGIRILFKSPKMR